MKKIVFILVCAVFTTYATAQQKQTQQDAFQATYNNIKALVQSKDYKFNGTFVYSNKNREQLATETNTLVVKRNNANVNIIGLSFNNKTITTKGSIQNYKVTFNDEKQIIAINFKVNNAEFYLDIKPNGNTFLTAKSSGVTITQIGKLIKL